MTKVPKKGPARQTAIKASVDGCCVKQAIDRGRYDMVQVQEKPHGCDKCVGKSHCSPIIEKLASAFRFQYPDLISKLLIEQWETDNAYRFAQMRFMEG
jgi:hypothetical protein